MSAREGRKQMLGPVAASLCPLPAKKERTPLAALKFTALPAAKRDQRPSSVAARLRPRRRDAQRLDRAIRIAAAPCQCRQTG
jgi:hypothetical protein